MLREPTAEQRIRRHAQHFALRVMKRDCVFILSQRYEGKREIGRYRSLVSLRRAIWRYGDRMYHARGLYPSD